MNFRKVFDSLKPFASVAASLVPGGSAAVALVNALLPEDKKLPPTATGGQVMSAVESMPPAQQASLMEKKIDLEIAKEEGWTERYNTMCQSDGQSTRPKIAYLMAWMLAIPYVLIGLAMGWAIYSKQVELTNMWPTLLAYLSIPLGILNKYFGELRKEQQNRLGTPSKNPLGALLAKLG